MRLPSEDHHGPKPRLSKDGKSHLSYEASCRLAENDERDLALDLLAPTCG